MKRSTFVYVQNADGQMTSRHKWYTLSGAVSRSVSFLAVKWAASATPNDLFPVAIFVYGVVELFGAVRGLKIMARFNAIQDKKLRKRTGIPVVSHPASASGVPGPRV